jgi:hypothetical protein
MPTDFFFDLAPVVRLAEHATAAPTHAADPAGHTNSETPALWLVKGTDGVWLASNGLPALPVNVLAPDTGNARVFARGWAPGNPALSRRLHMLDLEAITVVGAIGQPIDALASLLQAGHDRLRITVYPGGGSWLQVNDQDRDNGTGQAPDLVTSWLRAETGDDITVRPRRDDVDHPCRAHVENRRTARRGRRFPTGGGRRIADHPARPPRHGRADRRRRPDRERDSDPPHCRPARPGGSARVDRRLKGA